MVINYIKLSEEVEERVVTLIQVNPERYYNQDERRIKNEEELEEKQ